jgi:hypothetical protein
VAAFEIESTTSIYSGLLRVAELWVNCRLDVQTAVVVLHLLICNGGKDGIRDHRQGPSHHPETYP